MATYLELVKRLARESGSMDEDNITTVVGLNGRARKMAHWVSQAYTNIQNDRRDWGWLVASFTWNLIPGTAVYTPASLNLTRFTSWVKDKDWYMPLSIYDGSIGLSDEHEVRQVSHEYWRSRYGRGDQTSDYWNRPTEWAVSPRNELVFGPYPDKAYTIRSQYVKGPQTLAANSDIPEMPERFHQIIVWEALRLLMLHDGAYQEAAFPTQEMAILRHQLELDQLPEVVIP